MSGIDFGAVRAAISIQQVLELVGFEPCERRGPQLRGPCPIHHSQTPASRSFSVNLAKNAFRCFGCGAQGNQLDLWAQVQQSPMVEAATELCQRTNIPIPRLPISDRTRLQASQIEKRNP